MVFKLRTVLMYVCILMMMSNINIIPAIFCTIRKEYQEKDVETIWVDINSNYIVVGNTFTKNIPRSLSRIATIITEIFFLHSHK